MRILLSWLRDFVDVPVGAAELAEMLTMRGFEMAAIEEAPAAAALAPSLAATPGHAAGDAIIDLEITANRPDCLSVLGIAREVATAYDLPLRLPGSSDGVPIVRLSPVDRVDQDGLTVTLEDAELCPRYAAATAEVTIKPSPPWVAARLQAAGVRPINNVVDITNYVMLEIGKPIHAFDLARLAGTAIVIRRARPGEPVTTLDGAGRTLAGDMLVIADAERPQAIGGVMGGADSEVSLSTRRVAFESAYFKPLSVRVTSRTLGLKTEAAARFERGADIDSVVFALERACALLEQVGGGRARGTVVDRYPSPRALGSVNLRRDRVGRLLGQTVDDETVVRIFGALGFASAPTADGWRVTVPSWRVDIAREADLVEEIARHYGYDRLPATFPAPTGPGPCPDARTEQERRVRGILIAAGFSEAMTFSFIEEAAAAPFAAAPLVPVANPLSEKFAVLRPSILPGLVDSVAHNRRRERRDVRIFEIGSRFARDGERRALAVAWTGAGVPEHWSGPAREADFFDVKGAVERIGSALGVALEFVPARVPYLVEGRAATARAGATEVSALGQLAPAIAEARGLPPSDAVYVAELDLEALAAIAAPGERRVEPLPRFPSIVRDVSIVVDDALPAAAVRGTIRSAAPDTLVSVREFDRYKGQGVPEGRVSLSLRLTFQSPERTLTDADVQRAMEAIVGALAREHGAVQR